MNVDPLVSIGIFFLVLFFTAMLVGFALQRKRGGKASTEGAPDWVKSIGAGKPGTDMPASTLEAAERIASPVSEAIEALVQERIAADPGLQSRRIDFGTSPEGDLEIWLEDQLYHSVDQVPDERIRAIIQSAVAAYNQGLT